MLARSLIREHARERQAWERERRDLVRTICHLAGQPLPEPPLPVERNGYDEREALGLIEDPAQLPDH